MRILIISLLAISFINTGFAQVGIGTQTPASSALLDVNATNKGFLPPRMTTAQRDAIVSPVAGLMIFNTSTQSLEIFTDYGWYGIQMQLPPRKLLGGNGQDELYSVQKTADGGYIVAASSSSSTSGNVNGVNHGLGLGTTDYWIMKLDANRNVTWNKLFGGNNSETVTSIQQTSDDGYIIAGYSNSSANGDVSGTNHGDEDYWIVKLDDLGRIVWEKLIGGNGSDMAQSIQQTSDGGYIVAGYSSSSANGNVSDATHGGLDYWIVKLDDQGNITWNKLLGGTGDEEAHDVLQGADDTYVIAGQSTSSANGNVTSVNHGTSLVIDSWTVRLSLTGTILWNKLQGGNGDDQVQSIQQTTDGGYIMAGYSTSSANGDVTGVNHGPNLSSPDYWIIKSDRFGNITWNKLLGGNNFDKASCIKQTADGGYIVAGSSNSSANGDVTGSTHGNQSTRDYWIVKLDDTGIISWNQLLGGSEEDAVCSILQTADGGYIAAGYSISSFSGDVTSGNHGGKDIWIIKLGSNGYLY